MHIFLMLHHISRYACQAKDPGFLAAHCSLKSGRQAGREIREQLQWSILAEMTTCNPWWGRRWHAAFCWEEVDLSKNLLSGSALNCWMEGSKNIHHLF